MIKDVKVSELNEGEEIASVYTLPNFSRSSIKSSDETIFISSCFEKAFSSDQIGHLLNAKDNEKYWLSLKCGTNVSAFKEYPLNSSKDIVLICSLINENTFESSSLSNLLLFNISSKFLPISKNINSGAINSNLFVNEFKDIVLKTLPFDNKQEYILFESTTMYIFYLRECKNLFDKTLSVFSESSLTSSSVNCDLLTILFNSANLSNSGLIILAITKDNPNFDNLLISSSSSFGIETHISVMDNHNRFDYLKFSVDDESIIFTSTTTNILDYLEDFKYLSDNAVFIFSVNSSTSSSVNCDFLTILFNSAISSNLDISRLLNNIDQSMLDAFFKNSKSSGISIHTCAILSNNLEDSKYISFMVLLALREISEVAITKIRFK